MIRGLVKAFTYSLGLSAVCSYTKVGTTLSPIYQANMYGQWTPNGSIKYPGLSIALYADTSNTTITFRNEYLGSEVVHTLAGFLSLDWANVSFSGSAFAEVNGYRLEYDAIRVYSKNGSAILSSAGTLNLGYLTPSSIPFIGIPPKISCTLGPSYAPTLGVPPSYTFPFTHSLEGEGSVRGSWLIDGLPYDCTADILEPPANSCLTLLDLPSVTCTSTDNVQITTAYEGVFSCTSLGTALATMCTNGSAVIPAVYGVYKTEHTSRSSYGSIDMIPNMKKGVIKNGDEYRTLIYRDKFPRVRSQGSSVCTDLVAETSEVAVNERLEYPEMSEFLGEVGSELSTCEEAFTYESLSGYGLQSTAFEGEAYAYDLISAGACPAVGEGEPVGTIIPPDSGDDRAEYGSRGSVFSYAETAIMPFLQHLDSEASYHNTWINPHWSYLYYYPTDSEESALGWPIGSATDYWYPLKDQYMYHPALPGGGSKRRTSIVGNALAEGVRGAPCWWGYTRFECDAINSSGSYVLNGATLQTTGAVAWSGSSIVFSGSGIAEYVLGQWEEPYYTGLTRAGLGYSSTASGAFDIILIGRDGSKYTTVASGNNSGTIRFENLTGSHWAGSYGQDLDVGLSSVAALGGSADISLEVLAANPHAWSMLVGYMPRKIRIEASAGLILGLTLLGSSIKCAHLWETGQLATVAREMSNGFRFGNTTHWNYLLDQWSEQPLPLANGSKPTALDWLAYKRYMLQGKISDYRLQEEIEEKFNVFEGITRRSLAYHTVSWIKTEDKSVLGLYTNTYREIPPLAVLAEQSRNAYYQKTGDRVQHSYDWATSSRGIISPQVRIDLYDNTTRLTSLSSTVSGWKRVKWIPTYSYSDLENPVLKKVIHSNTSLASVLPWHSYLVVANPATGGVSYGRVATCMSNLGQLIYGVVSSGMINIGYYPAHLPREDHVLTPVVSGDDLSIGISPNGYLSMIYSASGSIRSSISYDYTTFSSGVVIGSGSNPRVNWPYAGYVNGTIRLYDLERLSTWDTGILASSFDIRQSGSRLELATLEPTLKIYHSYDAGVTWSLAGSSSVSGDNVRIGSFGEYLLFAVQSSGLLTYGRYSGVTELGSSYEVSSHGGYALGEYLLSLTQNGSSIQFGLSGDTGLTFMPIE